MVGSFVIRVGQRKGEEMTNGMRTVVAVVGMLCAVGAAIALGLAVTGDPIFLLFALGLTGFAVANGLLLRD